MTRPPALGSFRFFDDDRASFDSSLAFFATAQALALDASVVVDVGCGRGAMVDADEGRALQDLRGPGRHVIGIDIDPAGTDNPTLDEFRLIDDDRWPLEDGSVDLAVCDWTLEHVADPVAFVRELHRVLRPGGAFVARTVSRHSPLSLFARAVPNRRHASVLESLQPQRQERDVFPTVYAMNTRKALAALLERDFEWSVTHRPSLDQYLLRWPRAARAVMVVEARLPRSAQAVLVVAARKR